MTPARSRLVVSLFCTALTAGFLALVPAPASAASFNVGCSAAALISAVEDANATAGGDTLNLQAGCTYSLTARYDDEDGLPQIATPMIINGNGAVIERAAGSQSFGISDISSDLVISNVTLREFWGFNGAYFHISGSLVMVDTTITNAPPIGQQEAALQVGPAGEVAVVSSLIENQRDVDGGTGAAIENDGGLVVLDSTFRNNTTDSVAPGPAVQVGGAIFNSGTAQIFESTFTGNRSGATGGTIANSAGDLKVYDSTIVDGNANFGAGIYNSAASDLLVEDSYFASNDANLGGGAVYNSNDSIATIRNSSFYRNTANTDGGAILNTHAVRVEYSTFSENTADDAGDSISSTSGLAALEGSILSGTAGSSHCDGAMADFDHNVVHPALGSCPSGFTVGDPRLTGPADRGGDTFTMALGAGSAAFGAGSDTDCPAFDQRGIGRPIGVRCEAGALENQRPTLPGAPTASATPNSGSFTLTWAAATDPDGTPVTYELYRRPANSVVYQLVAEPTGASYSFTNHPEGSWRYAVSADDGNAVSGRGAPSATVVVDRSAPTAPTATADRVPDFVGDLEWYADTVTVSFAGSTDPVLADGSAGSGVASTTAPVTFATSGVHTATGSATDAAGNVGPATSLTVNVDATAPSLGFGSCPADVVLGSAAEATWTASDAHSGLATPGAGSFVLDTATIGIRQVVAAATDNVGHQTTVACTYRVVYDFTGFLKPLSNPPVENLVRAGDGVPLTFSLAGNQGLGVIAAGYPQSAPITCGTSPELEAGTTTTAQRSLLFSPSRGGRYTYLWRTQPEWAGTCRQVVVQLVDGTYHRANLRFE